MKLEICSLWGPLLDQFRGEVQLASELGFDVVAVGDSPSGWHEMVTSLTLAALAGLRAHIASLVTIRSLTAARKAL